jgi:hypothetical protein
MTAEGVKQLKIWLTSAGALIGSGIGLYEGFMYITESMDQTAKEKIEQFTLPVVQREIAFTVDSIFASRDNSFHVGLRVDPESKKVFYIHTNGIHYRAFFDSSHDKYYFINENNQTEWCK